MTLPRASGPCRGGKGAASSDKKKWGANHGPAPQQCQLNRCPRGLSHKVRLITWEGHRRVVTSSFTLGTILSETSLPQPVWFSQLILCAAPEVKVSQVKADRKPSKVICVLEKTTHTLLLNQLPRASTQYRTPIPVGCRVPRTACKPLHPPPSQTENLGTVRSEIRKDSWPASREPCGWCFLSDLTINLR